MSIEIKGLVELEKTLTDLSEDDKFFGIHYGLEKAVALIEREAKKKAPKGNGDLRRSITSKIEREGNELVGIVFTPLEYAPYVEYGTGIFAENGGRMDVPWNYKDDEGNWHSTSGMPPQPFMQPALNENREKIKKIMDKEMKKYLRGDYAD
jgi:HK97 gp10 family phage protein